VQNLLFCFSYIFTVLASSELSVSTVWELPKNNSVGDRMVDSREPIFDNDYFREFKAKIAQRHLPDQFTQKIEKSVTLSCPFKGTQA
jgi:hypothetical protein